MAEITEPRAGDEKEVIGIVEDKRKSDIGPAFERQKCDERESQL